MENFWNTQYRNRLPHITPPFATFFVTFRLADSLPRDVVRRLCKEYERELSRIRNNYPDQYKWKSSQERKRQFGNFDKQLDLNPYGECHLSKKEVAVIVQKKLHAHDNELYALIAYCIMSNHVHILIDTTLRFSQQGQEQIKCHRLSSIMHKIKGATAREINKKLHRKGPFWQKDSYDHMVRNSKEEGRIINYILQNPVKAGIVKTWEEFPFSYVAAPLGARG